ncbi:uncharacterized protein ChaoS9_360 [Halobacterium phage ChaoS9]|uniref:Uncharacterized protein n=1 Tax=Halobacterium phage ChaoS9 TaxID=2847105 RepID=A0A481V6Z2_9CAUD|nr:uncharacterized protein KMC41_gp73 [Halobacterium phage ChaoS9]QBI90077.1 uncharacterized protein ChaoS9_360 [Halobacterium phage ChaoS9]
MSGDSEAAGSQNARQAILQAVDDHATETGAPVGDVVEAALEDVDGGLGRVCSALQQLHADGEVYQPNPTTVRRVAVDGGNETGSPESRLEGVRKQLRLVLDDIEFKDEDAVEYVEGALACAESAAVCLKGPEVLEDEDSITDAPVPMVKSVGPLGTTVAGPEPGAYQRWESQREGGER